MNRPKNLDLYLVAEKMIFLSSVEYAVVMWISAVKGKVQFINTLRKIA